MHTLFSGILWAFLHSYMMIYNCNRSISYINNSLLNKATYLRILLLKKTFWSKNCLFSRNSNTFFKWMNEGIRAKLDFFRSGSLFCSIIQISREKKIFIWIRVIRCRISNFGMSFLFSSYVLRIIQMVESVMRFSLYLYSIHIESEYFEQ